MMSQHTHWVLQQCGWSPDRRIDPTPWITELTTVGYPSFLLLETILAEFGGLMGVFSHGHVIQVDNNQHASLSGEYMAENAYRFTINFTPSCAPDYHTADHWKQRRYIQAYNLHLAPIGMYSVYYFENPQAKTTLFLSSNGQLLRASGWQNFWVVGEKSLPYLGLLGESFAEGLDRLIQEQILYW